MSDDRRESKWIKWVNNWKYFIVCLVILLICVSTFFVTMTDVKYPEERYDTYIDVKEDGFETVNFFFSSRIEKSMGRPIIMKEAGMELLTGRYYPDGLYYKYSVVYRNGTILETEKEYISFGENRTLLDFDDIELSILQVFTGYEESLEGRVEELPLLVITFVGMLIFMVATTGTYLEANDPYKYRYKKRRW